jgi:hypothetical protein
MLLATPLQSRFGKARADSAAVTEPRASASGNEKSFFSSLLVLNVPLAVFAAGATCGGELLWR